MYIRRLVSCRSRSKLAVKRFWKVHAPTSRNVRSHLPIHPSNPIPIQPSPFCVFLSPMPELRSIAALLKPAARSRTSRPAPSINHLDPSAPILQLRHEGAVSPNASCDDSDGFPTVDAHAYSHASPYTPPPSSHAYSPQAPPANS
jgi:hypothetical protein